MVKTLMSAAPLCAAIVCAASCHSSDDSGSATALGATPQNPNTPPPGFVVRGQVYDSYNGLIDDAVLNIWVERANGGVSYWYVYGQLWSGDTGRYETQPLGESTISIAAFKHGYVQPCVYTLDLRGPPHDLEQNIEVMSQGALNSFSPPRPSVLPGPPFTGMVFETTTTGRQSVAGAEVWVDGLGGEGVYLGRTYSDFGGKYFLCNLPPGATLIVGKPGFRSVTRWIDTASQMDIELQRIR